MRGETATQVMSAIRVIKAFEGEQASISAKKILDNSNLSRSVLYKDHILKIWNKELWEERHFKKTKIQKKVEEQYKSGVEELQKELEKVYKEFENQYIEVNKFKKKYTDEKKRAEVYLDDIDKLKEKMKKLRGEIFRLQSILDSHNINY
jgi:valyl-tRNA synthetase